MDLRYKAVMAEKHGPHIARGIEDDSSQ